MPRHALALATALLAAGPLAAAEPITGRWITDDKDAVVEIAPCGKQLCGTIARFLVPPPGGADQRDTNNKDAAKRSRKLLGMMILTGFTPDEDAFHGRIYDPRNGRTYRSVLRRKSAGLLEVKGCMGPLCRTYQWVRAR